MISLSSFSQVIEMKAFKTYGKLHLELNLEKGILSYNSNFFSMKNEKKFGSFLVSKDKKIITKIKSLIKRLNKLSSTLNKGGSDLKDLYPSSAHGMNIYIDGKMISSGNPFYKKIEILIKKMISLKKKELKTVELKGGIVFIKNQGKVKKIKFDKKSCKNSICSIKDLGIIFL